MRFDSAFKVAGGGFGIGISPSAQEKLFLGKEDRVI